MHLLLSVTALTLLAILAVLIDIAMHLRLACDRIGLTQPVRLIRADSHHGVKSRRSRGGRAASYAIWAYEGGEWVLLQPCGREGCDCGPPPAEPGSYEGEVVRKECPRPKGR